MAIDDNTSYELTGYQVKDLAQKIRAKADSSSLASVATSGLYSDLTGAPTIPTVYNGTLTIQQDGTTLGTFSANQSTNETINITGGGSSYTAGNGISIDANNEISVDTAVVAEVSDIPTKTSDLQNDGSDGTSTYVEADDLATVATSGSYADLLNTPTIPAAQVNSDWNANSGVAEILNKPSLAAVATSGAYSDLTGTPTIPTVNDATLTITQNGTSAGTFTANASSNATIALTDTTYSDLTGATSSTAGVHGLVPAPAAGDQGKVLKGDGTWGTADASLVEMSYGESNAWAKFIAAYNAGSIVYCRASSNANPGTGSQTRKAFMAYVNNATSPTSVEFQYVRSVSSKTDSQQCDQVFVYTLTSSNGGTWSVASRDMATKINVDSTLNKTYSSGANASMTLGAKAMTGATSSAAGAAGIVPAPAAGDDTKFLAGDGTWKTAGGAEYAFKHLDTGQAITSATKAYLTNLSYTVQEGGAYLVIANGNIQAYNNSNAYPRIGIYVDDVRKAYTCVHVMDNPFLQLSYTVAEVITLNPGQTIKVGVENGISQVFEGNRLIVVQLADS